MIPGGGHAKGSSFERDTCQRLSKWLSYGQKTDLFNRNVLSGGAFTLAQAKNISRGTPGDLAASHPLSHEFLTYFMVECKHHADLHLEQLLYQDFRKTYIGNIMNKTMLQANLSNRHTLLIAKQNRIETLMFTNKKTGQLILSCIPTGRSIALILHHHMLYSGDVYIFTLENFLFMTDPKKLVQKVKTG